MKKKVIAMVLVGGRGTRLEAITKNTAKPAVPFAGKYRLIDFVLSNLSNSNIDTCGILTQYEPHELMSYISLGSTWDLDVNEGGVSFLTPYTTKEGDKWQKGTAHAIKQHIRYIDQYNPDYVLVLGGDHVYKMDYNHMIETHIKKKSDITISSFQVFGDPSRFGILEIDDNGKVISFEEKPKQPKSKTASMGIYVFSTKVLKDMLESEAERIIDFGKDLIPLSLELNKNVYCYEYKGYFRDVGTVESLYEANMDLLDNPQFLKLHEYIDSPIYTRSNNLPPHHIAEKSIVKNTLISDGCLIYGDIYHSVLSSGIYIGRGSVIKDTVIFGDVRIGEGCYIENAIITKGSVLLPKTKLQFDEVTVVDNEFLWKVGDRNE